MKKQNLKDNNVTPATHRDIALMAEITSVLADGLESDPKRIAVLGQKAPGSSKTLVECLKDSLDRWVDITDSSDMSDESITEADKDLMMANLELRHALARLLSFAEFTLGEG